MDNSAKYQSLLDEMKAMRKKQGQANMIGGIFDALGSGQSAGNFWLGRKANTSNVSGMADRASRFMENPFETEMARRQLAADDRKIELQKSVSDPGSDLAMRKRTMMAKLMPNSAGMFENMSAEEMDQYLPILSKRTAEISKREYDRERDKADRAHDLQIANIRAKNAGKNSKAFNMSDDQKDYWRKRGLSDEQISMAEAGLAGRNPLGNLNSIAERDELTTKDSDVISALDHSINELDSIINDFEANKDTIGPYDGRYPETLASKDWVQRKNTFHPRVGKLSDAYRKAITGTGASEFEIKNLMSRLPNEVDYDEAFMAKAKESRREAQNRRDNYIKTLERGGKFVDPLKTKPRFDADVIAYAQKHKISPEQALKIKQSRMGVTAQGE